jgi:hypothetical protein
MTLIAQDDDHKCSAVEKILVMELGAKISLGWRLA